MSGTSHCCASATAVASSSKQLRDSGTATWHSTRLQVRDDDGALSNEISTKTFVRD